MKLLLVALILAAIAYAVWKATRRTPTPPPPVLTPEDGYFISTASESAARANAVLPSRGSEDRSSLLTLPDLPPRQDDEDTEEGRDFLPDPVADWWVNVRVAGVAHLDRSRVLALFDRAWSEANGNPTVYGRELETGHWTYLVAADVSDHYTELALAWPLSPRFGNDGELPAPRQFLAYLQEVRRVLEPWGTVEVTPSASYTDAARAAAKLLELKQTCRRSATIVLAAPPDRPFEGRAIWDVMLSIGLDWGDMDIFHWTNEFDVGGDFHFSVWTSTPPGYFFPEEVAAGRVHTADLVFGFSIPRSADPNSVFESMHRAARYAQSRLGGELQDEAGEPFDPESERWFIDDVERRLREFGLEPGRDSTLRLF